MKCIKDIPIDKIKVGSKYIFINEECKDWLWNGACKSKDILEVMFVRNGEPANKKQYILFKNCTNQDANDSVVFYKDSITFRNSIFYDDSIQKP